MALPQTTLGNSLKQQIKQRLPRAINLGKPVVQLFLGPPMKTRYTFVNFASFFAPRQATAYEYKLTLYDQDGTRVCTHAVPVNAFGTIATDLESLHDGPLPEYGMLAASIRPSNFLAMKDRHLGRLTPHFYALFHDDDMMSMGLVHPQTRLDADPPIGVDWRSNLILDPADVVELDLYQLNPTGTQVATEMFLQSVSGERLFAASCVMPPYSVRRVRWSLTDLPERTGGVSVGIDGLAADNAKPIVFAKFANGGFSCCHS